MYIYTYILEVYIYIHMYTGEGIEGKFKPTLANGMKLMKLTDARKGGLDALTPTLLIILSPCLQSHYKDIKTLGDKLGIPVVALNSPYSYLYDIGNLTF
jgi:hypothetical protein